jgi:hypothetical protein
MEKDLAGRLNRLFCLGFVISSLACAQEATTSLSYTWDQPTGDFYATAQATLDYDSSYYYYVCVYIDLWQSSTDTFTYTSGVCDDEDAEQDWDTSVTNDSDITIDLESENDIYMDYYADQFGDWPDGYCWDAYQAYYFSGDVNEFGGADYNFAGPPGLGVGDAYSPIYVYAEASTCDCGTISPSTGGTFPQSSCPISSQILANGTGLFQQAANSPSCVIQSASSCTYEATGIFSSGGSGSVTVSNCGVDVSGAHAQANYTFSISGSSGSGNVDPVFTIVLQPPTGSNFSRSCSSSIQTISCP